MKEERSALILGSTGLTGSALADILGSDERWSQVILPVRKSWSRDNDRVKEVEINYDRMEEKKELFAVDDIFCCLGTTMKKAGSQEAFRRVDYAYPIEAARIAQEKGASRFFIITALGSDAGSKIFYNRVKGEVERDLEKYGFDALHIFRPSLLVGTRDESRFAEKAGIFFFKAFSFLFFGPLKKYRAIRGETVAKAMAAAADTEAKGIVIHASSEMQQYAGK